MSKAPPVLLALAAGAGAVLGAEWLRRSPSAASGPWLCVEVAAMAVALGVAWRRQDELRGRDLIIAAVVFQLALVAVRHHVGSLGDTDVNDVYTQQGHKLLDGTYPRSEYPPGGVLVFALDNLLGGGSARTSNGIVMAGFQAGLVASICGIRSRTALWFAAVVAFWPANAYFWLLRYDLAPTALLAAGLLLAERRRFGLAGVCLGVGAALKWIPALACLSLAIWLFSSRRVREGLRHSGGFLVALAAFNVPFLAAAPGAVLHAYAAQGPRTVTAESFIYPPLHLLGLAQIDRATGHIWESAETPHWANTLAIAIQLAVVLGALMIAVHVRGRLRPAVAVAALAPASFLLTNRIFSPQFAVEIEACFVIAAALLVRSRHGQAVIGCAVMAATAANALVYPARVDHWLYPSVAFFGLAFVLSAVLARIAWSQPARGAE
ncbi:MAG: DUF2029 domain-containing protein [Actinobacteria bacterium]|nr:DUF2029 domain-containing protein [Actinomycetota bacterium]